MLLRRGAALLLAIAALSLNTVDVYAAADVQTFYNANNISRYDPDAVIESCSSATTPGGNISAVDKNFNLGNEAKERRVNLIKALMKDFGLTAQQAAGAVGNFMQESGGQHLPPDVNQGGISGPPNSSGLGYGWAQWSGGRKTAFVNFLKSNGYMKDGRATDAGNYAFLSKELGSGYKITITDLKKQSNPADAALSFHTTYEKSGDNASQITERADSARQAFNEYQESGGSGGSADGSPANCGGEGSAAINGKTAFPLISTKTAIASQNRGLFANNTTGQSEHPYIAYDIVAKTGTPVVAFMSGKVSRLSSDKCGGRLVSIYNAQEKKTTSYMHLKYSTAVKVGDHVEPGDRIGVVGTLAQGCVVPHLHIDVVNGSVRVSCTRENCPPSNQKFFVDIGRQLFDAFELLP